MFYEKLLNEFDNKLKALQRKTVNLLDESNLANILCAQTLGSLKKLVEAEGFENVDMEVLFFKTQKVIPMKYLIYYTEVRSCELGMPKVGEQHQIEFLEEQVNKVNRFFGKHTEFLIYMNQGFEHFDKHYFTRKHLNDAQLIKSYPYYKDPVFNTSYDGILARIKGLGLFTKYLKEKKNNLVNSSSNHIPQQISKIRWTGSYAAFVEMMYGCVAMGYFNDGNINIRKIIEEVGDFLNIERGNSSRTYNELKNRRQSRVKFFEEAGQKLRSKMDKEDGKTLKS